jgi:hypothetical protein
LLLLLLLLLQVQADEEGIKAVKGVITEAVQIWLAWLKTGVTNSATDAVALQAAVGEAAGMDQQQVSQQYKQCCIAVHGLHCARMEAETEVSVQEGQSSL